MRNGGRSGCARQRLWRSARPSERLGLFPRPAAWRHTSVGGTAGGGARWRSASLPHGRADAKDANAAALQSIGYRKGGSVDCGRNPPGCQNDAPLTGAIRVHCFSFRSKILRSAYCDFSPSSPPRQHIGKPPNSFLRRSLKEEIPRIHGPDFHVATGTPSRHEGGTETPEERQHDLSKSSSLKSFIIGQCRERYTGVGIVLGERAGPVTFLLAVSSHRFHHRGAGFHIGRLPARGVIFVRAGGDKSLVDEFSPLSL